MKLTLGEHRLPVAKPQGLILLSRLGLDMKMLYMRNCDGPTRIGCHRLKLVLNEPSLQSPLVK